MPQNNLQELVLSLYDVCPGSELRVVRLDSEHLYPLSHLAGPTIQISNSAQSFSAYNAN